MSDLWETFKRDKFLMLLCYALFTVAFCITMGFYNRLLASWFYSNRYDYVYSMIIQRKLFTVVFNHLWRSALLYAVLMLLMCNRYTRYICLALPVFCGISAGVYFAVAINFGAGGIIAGVLVLVVGQLLNVTVIVVALGESSAFSCGCLSDVFCYYKLTRFAVILTILSKCIVNLVILGLILALF